MPASPRKAMGWNVTCARGVTIGPAGSTAGRTEQKAETQFGAMAGEAGMCCCPAHPAHPPESAVELLEAIAFCGICMGIGIATAATACPRIPMPKATIRVRTRSRATVPWLMNP